jgi:serine/threonine-protein kinase
MSTIFAATDAKLGRQVAVKVLRPEFGADAAFVERFRREAQAAASLSHPNIVAVYDYGTDAAGPYIVMEQVAGGDLSRVLDERGALPPTAVARTGQQVADALAAAHARGIVHRDIKPGNILLAPDGRVQVADFGIAQLAAESPVTSSGVTVGSVLYFSPEQARGDPATPASDVYSLGLVLYEMLTGQRAFSGDSPAAVAVARLSGGPPSPSAVRPEVPAPLDAIVRWCLATDPEGRPTAAELSATLTRFLADPTGSAAYASTSPYPAATAYGTTVAAAPPADPSATSMTVLMAQPPLPPPSERSGAGIWGWVAGILGLLVILASGVLLFILFSGMGEPSASSSPSPSPSPTAELVKTPDLIGLGERRAERLALEAGFEFEKRYQEADSAEVDLVIDQLPQPGTEVVSGTTLAVTIGTEAETVVVPTLAGLRIDDAEAVLTDAGLVLGEQFREDSNRRRDRVIRSEPRAGVSMTRGSAVDVYVSTGRSPDATATPRATKTPRPSRSPRPTPTPTPPPGPTPTPTPPPGPTPTPTAPPTTAPTPSPTPTPEPTPTPTPEPTPPPTPEPTPEPTPTPSPSPSPSPLPSLELVIVGDYSCQALGDVRSQIESVGLIVGTLIPEDPPPEDGWLVHGQLPPAGESVPVGSAVDLHLEDPVEPCPSA